MIKTGDHTGWVAGAFTFIDLVNAQATDHVQLTTLPLKLLWQLKSLSILPSQLPGKASCFGDQRQWMESGT